MTAWVFLPDHWHAICAPQYPLTISEAMKSVKISSTTLVNRGRATSGELWQGRFFDPAPLLLNIFVAGRRRALRTVREYNDRKNRRPQRRRSALRPLHGPYRIWQRRFYDLNVRSEKKRQEKLNYLHGNPVQRGMVTSPDLWPWSSFRFYFHDSVLPMDRLP